MASQTWEEILSLEERITGLTDEQRALDRASFSRLKELLGADWPRTARKQGHPLMSSLNSYAPWRTHWLADFTSTLDRLAADPCFGRLLGRLKDPQEYRGVESELEAAARLMDAGLAMGLVAAGTRKGPDLTCSVDEQTVYIEATDVRPPREYMRADKTNSAIVKFFSSLPPELGLVSRILRPLSNPHLEEVVHLLEKARGEVLSASLPFKEVREEGVVEAYVYRMEAREIVPKDMGLATVELPPLELDVWRLPKILGDKARQLPVGKPGAIFVRDQNLARVGLRPNFYRELAGYICETVYDHSRLCLAAVLQGYLSSPAVTHVETARDYQLVRRGRYDNSYQDDLLTVPNRYGRFAEIGSAMAARLRASA